MMGGLRRRHGPPPTRRRCRRRDAPPPRRLPRSPPDPTAPLAAFREDRSLAYWLMIGALLLLAGVLASVIWAWESSSGRPLVFTLLVGLTGGLAALARSRVVREERVTATVLTTSPPCSSRGPVRGQCLSAVRRAADHGGDGAARPRWSACRCTPGSPGGATAGHFWSCPPWTFPPPSIFCCRRSCRPSSTRTPRSGCTAPTDWCMCRCSACTYGRPRGTGVRSGGQSGGADARDGGAGLARRWPGAQTTFGLAAMTVLMAGALYAAAAIRLNQAGLATFGVTLVWRGRAWRWRRDTSRWGPLVCLRADPAGHCLRHARPFHAADGGPGACLVCVRRSSWPRWRPSRRPYGPSSRWGCSRRSPSAAPNCGARWPVRR